MSAWSLLLDDARWYPEQRADYTSTTDLTGDHIVIWDRKPYRVVSVKERGQALWTDEFRDRWAEDGMPEPAAWYRRPMVTVLRPEFDEAGERLHLLGPANHSWWTLPEHFAICRVCQEIPPCGHVHNEKVMEVESRKLDRDMALIPGVCHGCRGPISARQKTIVFEGENLIRPDLGDGTAIFHLRESCRAAAEAYDARWAKAVEGRRRKLFCEGRARHHYDGSMDCTEGVLCPGNVNHRSGEWHRPGYGITSGCWCVSGDLAGRIEEQMRAGDVPQ